MVARNLLEEPRSAGNKETWNTLVAKFTPEHHAAVCAVAAAAALTSVIEVEDGNDPPWRPDNEYPSEVLFDVISSRSALSGPGNDGQRFSHLQSIIYTDIGREEFERAIDDSLLAENRRRAGRGTARILAALRTVEPHGVGGKAPAGLLAWA